MYFRGLCAAIIVVLGLSLTNFAWADPEYAPSPRPYSQTLSADDATQLRRKVLPLIKAQKYKRAAKVATEKLGENWCDLLVEGRLDASFDGQNLIWDWEPHFSLFGGLTVLARQLGKVDLAVECALRSTEYTAQPSSLGMAAFELALLVEKMNAAQYGQFYETYFKNASTVNGHNCSLPAYSEPFAEVAKSWRKFASMQRSRQSTPNQVTSTPKSLDWLEKMPSAQKKQAMRQVVADWLLVSYRLNPTRAVAQRLIARKIRSADELAAANAQLLPKRVTTVSGPFDSLEKAQSWIIQDTNRQVPPKKLSNVSTLVVVDKSLLEWSERGENPFSTATLRVNHRMADIPNPEETPEYCTYAVSDFLLMRSSKTSPIYALPIKYEVPINDECGGYGDMNGGVSTTWFESSSGASKTLEISSGYFGYINTSCGPNSWGRQTQVICSGSKPKSLKCVEFGTWDGQRFGDYYAISLGPDGALKLESKRSEVVPNSVAPVLKKIDGMQVSEVYRRLDDLNDTINKKLLAEPNKTSDADK